MPPRVVRVMELKDVLSLLQTLMPLFLAVAVVGDGLMVMMLFCCCCGRLEINFALVFLVLFRCDGPCVQLQKQRTAREIQPRFAP